ncbi:MAG: chromosomal replication initiator protein DnaA [Proteobacteria bacterium]|nr:chromosomal replication initiator protein DnaA [Pseudomonadota bacterium]MCP4917111.1 chromosomal replication initiator protein DnaA [Pseudomonadota bacterium]
MWTDVQRRIEERIGVQNFEIWIKPIRMIELRGDVVALEVPNRYYSDWVRDNYQQVFLEELALAVGHPVRVEFSAEDEGKAGALEPTQTPVAPVEPPPRGGLLSNEKTFENYVVGQCNQFANAAGLAVADFPGSNYNPLFVFGDTGTGKTHLVHAIGNRIRRQNKAAGIIYTTAEDFVNDMIGGLRFKRMEQFRERYRKSADVLIIDDIQFLSGRDRSQEEFFHTFEALKNAGKQIILTADVLPKEIEGLAPRLRTRFEGGLLADIQPPDVETMMAILHAKAAPLGLHLPDEVALWISTRVRGNVRELEGAVNRLAALNRFYNEAMSIEFAQRHLGSMLAEDPKVLTPDRIKKSVARFFNIKETELNGRRKLKVIARPRMIAMYLARKHTELSFPDLGRAFGGRDHSTVQHACKKVAELIERDPDVRNHVEAIERSLGV